MTSRTAATTARATVYGYPRQGPNRELRKAIEGYWKGRVTADALRASSAELRRTNWRQLSEAGIHEVPTGDFSYYNMPPASVRSPAPPRAVRLRRAAERHSPRSGGRRRLAPCAALRPQTSRGHRILTAGTGRN